MFYVSPRDTVLIPNKSKMVRKKYKACFAFEGDDTAGRFEEKIWADKSDGSYDIDKCPVNAFFLRWGWKPKLVWKSLKGDDYMRFVGYEALLDNSKVVFDDGEMVMTPVAHN